MPVTVKKFSSAGEAHIAKSKLESAGIEAILIHENSAATFGIAFTQIAHEIELQVNEKDLRKAAWLLSDIN